MPQANVPSRNTVIRKYEADDLADIMTAWESASEVAHPFLPKEFQDQVRLDIPRLYLPNADTWVIEQSSQVIGFIALMGNEIGAIFVKSDFHRKGAGRALLAKAIRIHGDLEVEVFKANTIGRSFYKKCGFRLMGESFHEPTGQQLMRLRRTSEAYDG